MTLATVECTTSFDLPSYLARIGLPATSAGTLRADLATLRRLQQAHTQAIAFENLDPWLGREVALDLPALQAKLVHGGRGGYCYEHNLLLGAALRQIGFELTDLAARVSWNLPPGAPERPRTHMLLRVHGLEGRDWLVDAGFGGLTLTAPLAWDTEAEQHTAQACCRLHSLPAAEGTAMLPATQELQVRGQGEWQPLYRVGLEPQRLSDFQMASWYLGHHPASMFRLSLMAARPLADGSRWTLRDRRLSQWQPDGRAEVQVLTHAADLRDALADLFGLRLDGLAGLEERLAALPAD